MSRSAAAAVLGAGTVVATAALLLLRRRWLAVTVVGGSMLPALHDGDVLLVRRGGADRARVGELVVFAPPPVRGPSGSHPAADGPGAAVADPPPRRESGSGDSELRPVDHGPHPVAARDAPTGAGASGPGWMVKRVAAVPGDPVPDAVPVTGAVPPGTLVVLGDNGGYDSRVFGALPVARVLGVGGRRVRRGASDREYVLLDDVREDPLLDHVARPVHPPRTG